MAQPYHVWPFYYPQQQHPYFQVPPNPQTTTETGFLPPPPMSRQGSPYTTPSVLPPLLPVIPAAPPIAEQVTPGYQPMVLYPNYSHPRHPTGAAYVPVQVAAPPMAPLPAVAPPYFTYSSGWALAPRELQRPQLHNLINGEIVTHRLYINFAKADLEFRRHTRSGDYDLVTLSTYDLEQPATNPPITRIQIVCDAISQWPIDLQVNDTSLLSHRRQRGALPYLTLEDLVHAVHASLHRKISHKEWTRLSASLEADVARAYSRRYKASGSERRVLQQQWEGVKRVDYLLKNTWFKGFTWLEPVNGVERLKLLVGQDR